MWVWLYLPELKNRTLQEIDEMFEARLPARKFRTYVCTGRFAAGSEDKIVERRSSAGSGKVETVRHEIDLEKSG